MKTQQHIYQLGMRRCNMSVKLTRILPQDFRGSFELVVSLVERMIEVMKRNRRVKRIVRATSILATFVVIGVVAPVITYAALTEEAPEMVVDLEPEIVVDLEPEVVVAPESDVVTSSPEIEFEPASDVYHNNETIVIGEVLLNEGKPIVINEIPNYHFEGI